MKPARLILTARSRLTVDVTGLGSYGRFKIYGMDLNEGETLVRDEGCLAPGGTSPIRCSESKPTGELWATVDVCNPADQPNTVGIRGSMPNDSRSDAQYMSFRLQYQLSDGTWSDLPGGDHSYRLVGNGESARQGGTNFNLEPTPGASPTVLRGDVSFQWRRGEAVVQSAALSTTAGHLSLAGVDPPGYSASTCTI